MMRAASDRTGRISRRRALGAGAALALVLAGATVAAVRTRGYAVPPGRRLVALTPWQFVVVRSAARRIAAPDREGDPSIPSADDTDVPGSIDLWVSRMHGRVRRDFGRFLAYLEHVAPVGAGFASRFTRLSPADQDAVLAALEQSPHDRLRAGFEGLKSLVFIGYYRDVRTWKLARYDGPLLARPLGGWR